MTNEEKILKLVEGAKTPEDVVRILLKTEMISTTAMKDLDVYYTYTDKRRESQTIMHAVYDTEIETGCSKDRVYRARKRFKENK
jgi:hypothetical protein